MDSSAPLQSDEPAGSALFPAGVADPAAVLCRAGEVVWASDGLAELLGHSSVPTVVGQRLSKLLDEFGVQIDEPDARRSMTCRMVSRSEEDERVVRADQIEVPGTGDAPATELWLFRDISLEADVQRLVGALQGSDAKLENLRKELNQDRDELIALLSHELRTPLTIISGYSKLLLSGRAGKLSDEQYRYLEESRNSCQRLNALVIDLLDASYDHSSDFSLALEERAISESVRAVIEFFLPLLEEKGLRVDIAASSEVPLARFDPARIEQVLTNVLGNAVKYTRSDSVIDVQIQPVVGERSPMIEVAITDDGPGISAEDSRRIFEPYVRSTSDRRVGGVGLGLAICRRILESHGGEIWVEPAPGRGSRFVFSIPALAHSSRVEC